MAWVKKKQERYKTPELIYYNLYIKSAYWEDRKRRYYEKHAQACAICGDPHVELNHIKYGNYGNEDDKDLVPLCRIHHEGFHAVIGVRGNMRYQAPIYIEDERTKFLGTIDASDRLAKQVASVTPSGSILEFIHRIARPILRIVHKIF